MPSNATGNGTTFTPLISPERRCLLHISPLP